MKLELTRKREFRTTPWSGGTTTQLAIFPKDAGFLDRDFQFRLSTSEITVEESVFTSLPGVSRTLLVLDGELRLHHPGRYAKVLKKFDTDSFMGDWQTRSMGKVIDFNLMTTGSTRGHLEGITLRKSASKMFELSEIRDVAGIYAVKGEYSVEVAEHKVDLSAGDNLLLFTDNKTETIRILSKAAGELVFVEIQF